MTVFDSKRHAIVDCIREFSTVIPGRGEQHTLAGQTRYLIDEDMMSHIANEILLRLDRAEQLHTIVRK